MEVRKCVEAAVLHEGPVYIRLTGIMNQPIVHRKDFNFEIGKALTLKDGKEIFLLARPSDGGEVRIFYETEKDLLDYSMDWELWVEDGKNEPQKITFGKIIKLTGLNRIPLKGI